MVHYEGGVEVELRYFLGGVGDRVKKAAALICSKPPQAEFMAWVWAAERRLFLPLFGRILILYYQTQV